MAEIRDSHIVEIPADHEQKSQNLSSSNNKSAIQHRPLKEISESPGHLLLLRLWQREEYLFSCRIGMKEARLDNIRREVLQLCRFFFAFRGFYLTLLFASSIQFQYQTCRKWYVRASEQSQNERSNSRALARCIQELRMKGASFDLSKEPRTTKRMKRSSVELRWKPLKWFSQNLVGISLICFTGMIFPFSKFALYS